MPVMKSLESLAATLQITLPAAGIGLLGALAVTTSADATVNSTAAPLAGLPEVAAPKATPASAPERQQAMASFAHLPLFFEENQGQSASAVRYLAHGTGYGVFLTGDAAVLRLGQPSIARNGDSSERPRATDHSSVIDIQLAGAHKSPAVIGEDLLPGRSNYLVGNNPTHWHTHVRQYSQVRYRNVYDGVDLVYHGDQQRLEYDFIVDHNANPDSIHLKFTGITQASVDQQGDLHLRSGGNDLVEHKPVAYQLRDGQREPVPCAFHLIHRGDNSTQVGFQVASYDKDRPLIIDPVLDYSTYLGGTTDNAVAGGDGIYGTAVDSSGAVYVTGSTYATDFPTTIGAFQTTSKAGSDSASAFVTKLSPDGHTLIYSTYLGGTASSGGDAIAIDASGAAYVAGGTSANDFPVTAGAFQTVFKATSNFYIHFNAFVSKLSPDGSQLSYSTYVGGSNAEGAAAIAVDSSGAAYITGDTSSPDYPVTPHAFQTVLKADVNANESNAFISKLSADGSHLAYSTFLGGTTFEVGYGIAVDGSGSAYVAGITGSTDFPATTGAFQTSLKATGGISGFVTKLNPSGNHLTYSTYLSGSTWDQAIAIAIDSAGAAYVTGYAGSSDFPTTAGAFQTQFKAATGSSNAFVTKLNAKGSKLIYSTYIGGSGSDEAAGIAVDSSGAAYVTGGSSSSDFPTTPGAYQTTLKAKTNGFTNAFISKVSADGSQLGYSTYLGGTFLDFAKAIAVNSGGAAYVAGFTSSTDFPITAGAFQSTLNASNGQTAFVSKLIPVSLAPTALAFGKVDTGDAGSQTVTLSNQSDASMAISSITVGSPVFAQTSSCGSTLAAGSTCVITVSFSPTATGPANSTLTVTTSVDTFTTALTGTGVTPTAKLSTATLSFGNQNIGTTSKAQTVTLTNTGTGPLKLTSIAGASPFTQSNDCGTSLEAGAACTISVSFAPTAAGDASGSLTITSNAASSPDSVSLSGTGISPSDGSGGGAFDLVALIVLGLGAIGRRAKARAGS